MQKLAITVDMKEARANAWIMGVITIGLIVVPTILMILGKVVWDGDYLFIPFALLLFGWLYGTLIWQTLKLTRLSKFSGTLLEISSAGLQVNWFKPGKFVKWDEIQYLEWRDAKFTRTFNVTMKQRSLLWRIKSFFGFRTIDFPEQYLLPSAREISQFLLEHVPSELLR